MRVTVDPTLCEGNGVCEKLGSASATAPGCSWSGPGRFLYHEVLGVEVARIEDVVRASTPKRLPTVLTRSEVKAVLGRMKGTTRIMATLLYGGGLRLVECVRLRVKDVDLERREITVRSGKGDKDRVTMLPETLVEPLRERLARLRERHRAELLEGWGSVSLPHALARKCASASREL